MSRKSNRLDNAVVEGFFYGRNLGVADDLIDDFGEWIDRYDTERIKTDLGETRLVDYRLAVA